MFRLSNFPLVLFLFSMLFLWGAAKLGTRWAHLVEEIREDFATVLAATLTLLGLIVGFTFSMAVGRYDQRKDYEEEEANAIGTEYLRLDLLPDAGNIRKLMRDYLDKRIQRYVLRDGEELDKVQAATAELQNQMWAGVRSIATAQPTPITSLVVAGMNDVINRQGYTHAAWHNQIPRAAWALLLFIALCANFMVGLSLRHQAGRGPMILILPFIVSIALLLIADLDAPTGGLIRVSPENLIELTKSLQP